MEENYYALRITPYPNTEDKTAKCRSCIPEFIRRIGGLDYLVGQEYEKNHHFHIVFTHPIKFNPQDKRDKTAQLIKQILYELFEVPDDKKGNPSFSLEQVRAIDEALSYAIKGGDYDNSQNWEELAKEAYENSYEKKYSLKSSLADLSDKYIKGEINDRALWVALGQTRADLGIPLSIRWIDEMFLSIQCKKNPTKLIDLWEERLIKEGLKSL